MEEESKFATLQQKRADIQGLRGIAIIYVLAFHLKPQICPMGFLGVDIFFVLSGYLMCMILSRTDPVTWTAVQNFAAKRFKRIFPAYFLALMLILLFGYCLLASNDFAIQRRYSLWAAAFATNFLKLIEERDYFAELANYDFLLHTWSLAVEVQFYIAAPLLMLIRQRFRFGCHLLAVIGVSSLWLHVQQIGSLSFSFMPSRLWQFFIGATAFQLGESNNACQNITGDAACKKEGSCPLHLKALNIVSLLLISPIFILLSTNEKCFRIIVTASTGILIAFRWRYLTDIILANHILTTIGDISYSLYLAHWPVILFIKYIKDRSALSFQDTVDGALYSLAIAFLSYHYVENFFMRSKTKYSFLFVAGSCAVLACIWNASTVPTPQLYPISADYPNASHTSAPTTLQKITDKMRRIAISENKKVKKMFFPELPEGFVSSEDPIASELCSRNKVKECGRALFKGAGNTTVVILGNSFAEVAQYYILPAFGYSRIKELHRFSSGHCGGFRNVAYLPKCVSFTDTMITAISKVKPDVVFFNFLFNNPLTSEFKDLSNDEVFRNMQSTIDELSNYTKRIVITYDHPWENRNFPNELIKKLELRMTLEDVYIPFERFWLRHGFAYRRLNALRCPICEHVFTYRLFCNSKRCNVFDQKTFVSYFRDNCHLGLRGIELVKPLYEELVDDMYAKKYF